VTTFLLLRHAAHDWLGRGIAGRLPGVSLNAEGERQAQELVARLGEVPLQDIYCSPQPRTQQTALPLARQRGLAFAVEDGVDEIDFGDWAGLEFAQLRAQGQAWTDWCERRGSAQPPGGEPFAGVPQRALAVLCKLQLRHPEGNVLVVSHGDVIKAVLADSLGLSLDGLERFEIAPASVSVLAMGADWRQVKLVNGRARLP
jgi:probable phosphoglycerate mutase